MAQNIPTDSGKPPRQTGQITYGGKSNYVTEEFINNPITRQIFEKYGLNLYNPQVPGPQGEQWTVMPREVNYWQDSRRIGRYYNALRSLPEGTQAPSWLDADRINAAYKQLSDEYGTDWQTWGLLEKTHPVYQFMGEQQPPPLTQLPKWEQQDLETAQTTLLDTTPKTDSGPVGEWTNYGIDYATWQTLPEWKRNMNRIFRTMGGQMGMQAVNLGIAGFSVAGPAGAVVGGGLGTGLGYLGTLEQERQARMGEAYKPGFAYYTIGALNFLFTQAQQAIGLVVQLQNARANPELYGTTDEILSNLSAAYEAGEGYWALLPVEIAGMQRDIDARRAAQGKAVPDWYGFNQLIESGQIQLSEADRKSWEEAKQHPNEYRVINIAGEDTWLPLEPGVSHTGAELTKIRRMLADGKMSPNQVLEYTVQKYGFTSEMSDLLAGYVVDPLDSIGPITSKVIGKVAVKSGNVPLAKAFAYNDELLSGYRQYRQELRQMPVDDLRKMSNVARWFAGVDKSGQDVTLRQKQRGFVDKMFGATPQARADESLHQFMDGVSTLLDMENGNVDGMYRITTALAGTPIQAVDAVANGKIKVNVGGVLTDVDMPRWTLSAEAQVLPLMLKDQMPKVKDHYDLYRNTRPQANLLTRMADALGEDAYRTIADLHTGKTDFDTLMRRITALANEGNKPAADFLKNTTSMKDLSNAALKKAADLFSGEAGAAFDGKMWGVQLMYILSEGAEKWAVDWFGIKPSGWVIRLGEVIKKAQSALLLGLNPSYLANNTINNIVTLAWDGLLSSMSKKQRMGWMRRYGITTQLHKGLGGAEIGVVDVGVVPGTETGKGTYQLGKYLREATRAKDGIQKTQDLLGTGNKFMVAATLSQKVERWTSEIAVVKGTMEYWNQYWRAGVGFDKMPSYLRMVLDAAQPGLADKVEKAIARGLNKEEIEAEIFTRLEVPSLRDVMTPEELHMMSSFPELMDEIDNGMRNATTGEERRAVFQKAIAGMEKKIYEDIARKSTALVHQIAAKIQVEGYAGAFDVLDTLVPERYEILQQHLQHMDDVAIRAEELVGLERANLWREELEIADYEWRTFQNAEGIKWMSIFEGLGAESTSDIGIMVERHLMDIHAVWENFYNTRNTLMDEYFSFIDTTDFTGFSKEEARVMRSAKWSEISEKLNVYYGEAIIVEDLYQSELDSMFNKQYAAQFGTDAGLAAIQWRDEQRKIRRTMVEAQLLWRTANLSENIKKTFGVLLPKETVEKILLLNGNEPIYKMSVGERDKANQKFYREIYRPLLGEMMKAPEIEKPGDLKVKRPKPEKTTKPKESSQSAVWKYISEVKPELAGIDENGRPVPDAKLNIIKWLRKWSETARDNNVKKWAEVTPALIHEAAQAEDYFNAHKPETAPEVVQVEITTAMRKSLTLEGFSARDIDVMTPDRVISELKAANERRIEQGLKPYDLPVEEAAPVTEVAIEAPAEPVQEISTEPVTPEIDTESIEISDALAEEARFTEGLSPEAAAEVEQAQRAAAAREQVIAQAESMRQNVDEIMRLAPPKEVTGEIFREYIHQIMSDKYPDKPNHAAHRADAVWTVIDRIATTLAAEKGISKDEWYSNFVLSRGGERIWGDNALYRFAPVPFELHAWAKIAKEHFGITNNIHEAGYILPDGTMLDLTGRHYATGYERVGDRFRAQQGQPDYVRGTRSVDHRELPDTIYDQVKVSNDDNRNNLTMLRFMKETGAVRVSYDAGLISIVAPITTEQASILRDYYSDGWMEVDNPDTGRSILNQEFEGYGKTQMRALLDKANTAAGGTPLARTDPEQFYARLDRLEYTRTDDGIDYTLHFKNKESTGDLLTYEEARTVLGDDLTAQILAGEDAGIITGEALRKIKPGGYSVRGATGITYWLDNGKAVMHAFSRADIADVMHEYIHAITPLLPDNDLRTIERWYAKEYGRELGADWMDKTYPDVDAFEKLARAFERYMTEGPTGFVGEIVQAFENIKAWMLDIYKSLTNADIDIRMNDQIRAMFDRWLGQEPKQTAEPAPIEPAPSVWQKRTQTGVVSGKTAFTSAEKKYITEQLITAAKQFEEAQLSSKVDAKDIIRELADVKELGALPVTTDDGFILKVMDRRNKPIKDGDITAKKTDKGWLITYPDSSLAKFDKGNSNRLDFVITATRDVVKKLVRASGVWTPFTIEVGNAKFTVENSGQANRLYRGITGKSLPGFEDIPTKNAVLYRIPTDSEGAPFNEPQAQSAPLGTADELMGVPLEEITMAGWNQHLRPALERAQNAMLSQSIGKIDLEASLSPEGMVSLRNYLGRVYSQMPDVKMGATRWGESRRNAALLDYSKRTGIDNTILCILPYQFWYTRTAINWALRVLNKPSILANYYRLLRMSQRKEERDGYPRRLKGKMPIPAPWLPDFMGDNIYIDPWKQALPILQMTRPFERAAEEKNQVARRTEQLIYDMVDSGEITDEQAQQAVNDKGGATYIKAKAQAESESERDFQNQFDFAFSLSAPLLPISIAYNVATGRADKISQLPFTRLVQNLTAMAGIGGPRGVNLESGIRNAAGLPTIDRFEDYRIDRELASMTADGLIDADTAQQAMIDRKGDVFTEAQRRVSQQGVIRYMGTALALDLFPEGEAKQRGLQDEFSAAYDAKAKGDKEAVNEFFDKYPEYSARLATFKEPEERLRAFLRGMIWEKYLALPKAQSKKFREAAGDIFTEAFLDSKTRSYDSINTDTLAMWANTLGETPQTASKAELPVDWLDDETAKQIDTYFNERKRIFGEYDPNAELDPNFSLWQNQYLAQHPNLIQYVIGENNALYGLPQDIQAYVYKYRAARDTRYPDIFNVQEKYFTITNSAQKKVYLKAHPELKEYWGWRKQMAANFPKAAAYIMSEESLSAEILDEDYVSYGGNVGGGGLSTSTAGTNYGGVTYSDGRPAEGYHPPYLTSSELRRFSQPLVLQLLAMFYRNEGLMPGANREITQIWEELGKPFGTLADFIEFAVKPTLTQ